MPYTHRHSHTQKLERDGLHRFEHWRRDNCAYLITARVRHRARAFTSEQAKAIFWDRFGHYTDTYGFTPIVTSLIANHYHTVGYMREGENLGVMMKGIHGSIAKLVNDLLPTRIRPFWVDRGHQNYWDGCLRDEVQFRRTYLYVRHQAMRHGLARTWQEYPHTRVNVGLEVALKRLVELRAFLYGVPYKRYLNTRKQ